MSYPTLQLRRANAAGLRLSRRRPSGTALSRTHRCCSRASLPAHTYKYPTAIAMPNGQTPPHITCTPQAIVDSSCPHLSTMSIGLQLTCLLPLPPRSQQGTRSLLNLSREPSLLHPRSIQYALCSALRYVSHFSNEQTSGSWLNQEWRTTR